MKYMKNLTVSQRIAFGLSLCGVVLHSYTAFVQGAPEINTFLIGLWLWSMLPYAIWFFVARKPTLAPLAIGALALCLPADAAMFYQVFVKPTSSTAALGLLFIPLWNLILIGPAGALIVGIARWGYRKLKA